LQPAAPRAAWEEALPIVLQAIPFFPTGVPASVTQHPDRRRDDEHEWVDLRHRLRRPENSRVDSDAVAANGPVARLSTLKSGIVFPETIRRCKCAQIALVFG
jgi:hypothetical protein